MVITKILTIAFIRYNNQFGSNWPRLALSYVLSVTFGYLKIFSSDNILGKWVQVVTFTSCNWNNWRSLAGTAFKFFTGRVKTCLEGHSVFNAVVSTVGYFDQSWASKDMFALLLLAFAFVFFCFCSVVSMHQKSVASKSKHCSTI